MDRIPNHDDTLKTLMEFVNNNNINVVRKDNKRGNPLKSDYICAIQKWEHPTPMKRKFINVNNLIKKLPASELCQGNGLKIIPFLRKISKQKKITEFCRFEGALQDKTIHKGSLAINFKGDTYNLNPAIYIPKTYKCFINACQQPIIILQLGLINVVGNQGHSNLIIIDKITKEYERFEPHGQMIYYDDTPVDLMIKRYLGDLLPDYKYIKPLDYCPLIGPQRIVRKRNPKCPDTSGFCSVWTTLYAHLRILNPKFTRSEIVAKMITLAGKESYLEKYLSYIEIIIPNIEIQKRMLKPYNPKI